VLTHEIFLNRSSGSKIEFSPAQTKKLLLRSLVFTP